MVYRQENEYPSNPCTRISAGPEPARKYLMRAPSMFIQHSSTPAARAGASAEEVFRSPSATAKFLAPNLHDPGQLFSRLRLLSKRTTPLFTSPLGEPRLPAFSRVLLRPAILSVACASPWPSACG